MSSVSGRRTPTHLLPLFTALACLCLSAACGDGGSPQWPNGGGPAGSSGGGSSGGGSSGGGSSGGSSSSGTSSSGATGGGSSGASSSGVGSSSGGSSSGGSSSGGSSSSGGADGGAAVDGGQGGTGDGGPGGGALDPTVAPGGNFDLSLWELQEPVGSPGAPTTISPSQLQGPNGYQDKYFFTDPTDGSMTFWDPENGVTTKNSNYPRSELREMTAAGAAANWAITGTHTLSATLKATLIPDHVAVGQIHLGTGTPASTKPLLELFYYSTGDIRLDIEQTPAGGNEVQHPVGNVPLGTEWSYVIGLSGNTISLIVNGGAPQTFTMSSTLRSGGHVLQGRRLRSVGREQRDVGAKVQFYALKVFHGP